jgi:uncharacterized membrane protein YcaP (DUF421 family)
MMSHLFDFQVSPLELIVRGTLIYWFLFLLFRFVLRRDAGAMGIADILLVVLIADAAQNGMAGESKSVGEAVVVVATLAVWNYFFDRMSFHFEWFAKFAEPGVLTLVKHGVIQRSSLRREMLTKEDLESQLRLSGIEDIAQVKHAYLEPDGHVSVIRYTPVEVPHRTEGPRGAA